MVSPKLSGLVQPIDGVCRQIASVQTASCKPGISGSDETTDAPRQPCRDRPCWRACVPSHGRRAGCGSERHLHHGQLSRRCPRRRRRGGQEERHRRGRGRCPAFAAEAARACHGLPSPASAENRERRRAGRWHQRALGAQFDNRIHCQSRFFIPAGCGARAVATGKSALRRDPGAAHFGRAGLAVRAVAHLRR